jgi:hypothetical protein
LCRVTQLRRFFGDVFADVYADVNEAANRTSLASAAGVVVVEFAGRQVFRGDQIRRNFDILATFLRPG